MENPDSPERGLEPFSILACAVAASYAGALALLFLRHQWIVDANGRPIVTDFMEVWVAGRFALAGTSVAAYDWHAHHAAQAALVGHDFQGVLNWSYPPLFLFVAALLACLPYTIAFAGWVAATAAAYAATIGAIAKRWDAGFAACAAPVFFANALVGQNGFLSGALIGAALLFLRQRPVLSGVFLGLLTYKPQLGVLFPLALLLDRNWRALASASVTSVVLIALSWLTFGAQTFMAFLHFLPATSQVILTQGGEDWRKMQSVYALARTLGAGDAMGWIAQIATIALCAALLVWIWRGQAPFAVKAAFLAAASMLVTPYLHMYDFAVLAVPFAFLFRERAFDRIEWTGAILANVLFVGFAIYPVPVGPAIIAIVLALVLRRAAQAALRYDRSPVVSDAGLLAGH
jgi:arabinofuranan 3-O-arabinosyltransferase